MKNKTRYIVNLQNEPSEEAQSILNKYALDKMLKLDTEEKRNPAQ
jgi:hypothetical protein